MTSKYDPFGEYLLSIPTQTRNLTVSFEKIQEILGFTLPASALHYQAWWANEVDPKHPQKLCWQTAGWRVDELDLSRRLVSFRRFSTPVTQLQAELTNVTNIVSAHPPK